MDDLSKPQKLVIARRDIPLINGGYVELTDMMPHPVFGESLETYIANIARVSFLGDSKGEEKDRKLFNRLIKDRHTSPLEFGEFTYRIKAPIVVWWQWVRHRMSEYSGQSGRYTPYDLDMTDDVYIPSVWRKQSASNKQGSGENFDFLQSSLMTGMFQAQVERSFDLYQRYLEMGMAKEMARFVLPSFVLHHTFYVKMNLHALIHFIGLRSALDAQWEIRQYSDALLDILSEQSPTLGEYIRTEILTKSE